MMLHKYFNRAAIRRTAISFLVALVVATVLGTLIQSQVNLIAIANLVGSISLRDWLATCWFDLLHFSPTLALILLPTLALAFLVAAALTRFYARSRYLVYFAISAFAIYAALTLINYLAPMPTLIAANRSSVGTLLLVASGGAGALAFVYWRFDKR